MAAKLAVHDPLALNLRGQTLFLLEKLPLDSPHAKTLRSVPSRSQLLQTLSHLLHTPSLTTLVATAFRPILLDLCARWLENSENLYEKLEAVCLLLEIHPELYPILSNLLNLPEFEHGPLTFLETAEPIRSLDASFLQRILLAYYRILQANRGLPPSLNWPLTSLSQLIWAPHPDNGVRFLAIRCYALQTGMMEAERVKMETEIIGAMGEVDFQVNHSETVDGTTQLVDGWVMPIIEATRVVDARNTLLIEQNYYAYADGDSIEPIHPAELSPLIVNVQGILMFRTSCTTVPTSPLVPTSTTAEALRTLAVHISLGVPTLLTSSPSSGKTLLLTHLATLLHSNTKNQLVTIHLADTTLDPRSLLGSYVTSPTRPGTFDWKEGVLIRAMREGRWVVFEDIDRGSSEVLGLIKPLLESLGVDRWIGGRGGLEVPGRGYTEASEDFKVFATRSLTPSRNGMFPASTFYGAHKFHDVVIASPTHDDLQTIVNARFPRLSGAPSQGLIRLWEAVRDLGLTSSTRTVGIHELEKLCMRVEKLLPPSHQPMDVDSDDVQGVTLWKIFSNPTICEDIYLEARDVFFGSGSTTLAARVHLDSIAVVVAEHLGLSPEKRDWLLRGRTPEFSVEKDVNGSVISVRLGANRLIAATNEADTLQVTRPFAMHKPAISLICRIASAVTLGEPILLTGETGTGKTSVITHLAALLRKPLISLNLSNQTESSDIIGGFKPVDTRIPASELQGRFLDLFGGTFSRKKNAHFEESIRKAVQEGKWKRAVILWLESVRLARERIQARLADEANQPREAEIPRKRRKTGQNGLNVSEREWIDFEDDVRKFQVQHVEGNGKFAFGFVEGPLVKALRAGHWILLDEVNLASAETLECISSLLHGPTASITLTEQGSLEPVPRHPNFRLFACMNPATDVGKKDLPPNIRSRFTEIDVPPPDADKETLLSIIAHYIGACAVGDKAAIMDTAEFYTAVRTLAEKREIADGSNHKPHFSMRTLARALTFTADLASTYSLRRALWEGCLMAFTMVLDRPSAAVVTSLAQKHILAGVRNPRSLLAKEPTLPPSRSADSFVKFGPFYLERGPLPEDFMEEYIMTPSVETKLIDLARILVTRRFPVLIEGPTSSGKTSSIEYLARRTGHRFVRINNHEHTDIQEYLGTYVSDPTTGKLVFKDGLLVRALRNGDWIVLDELNLAPTDVLEALNRLLDDNRELVIPETQEVVRPHPQFMLFATQNPPGLYAGRKVLSRAFRNRFLEVHFEDVPQSELETILCQRCRIAPSYGQRIVAVFQELQKRRQSSRIFESKHGFATLRDLFRWAGRDAINYQELAENGYMLLAERARREEDKAVVKEVMETIMKVRIDPSRMYNLGPSRPDVASYLGCPVPASSKLVWTLAMQRLFVLLARALRFNEPVLLVGETGCGKTSVCQQYADIVSQALYMVNCHQNTETADLIGGLRPVRNKSALEGEILHIASPLLESLGHQIDASHPSEAMPAITAAINVLLKSADLDATVREDLLNVHSKIQRLSIMFEWHDGPLIEAMRNGSVFLMDEISLADDSVLERLNSVLETGRAIVLAERGGDTHELSHITAAEAFKLVATMNPGGDYGKKELSPALRNRFTEIWVPSVDDRQDRELIISSLWKHDALRNQTTPLLDFTDWLGVRVNDQTVTSLRDILAWVDFSNAAYQADRSQTMSVNAIFHHAANMTFLDGLGSLAQLSSYSQSALAQLREEALVKLKELAPIAEESLEDTAISDSSEYIQLGSFSIPRGPGQANPNLFSFQAPTTRDNVNRVVRASQLMKPILLEGSPGVGKTSLVSALANICGYRLCRINLSDQTDLVDLFGSDLPVEGGGPGEFAWKDAEFLRALQEGDWVLLDEMNLAPQAVLEGLNAVLDHRGTVYIPELGRSFTRHPSFRIFAAQNPLHQGGGRKGLPKSFLNRFTKVYVQELSSQDMLLVCRSLFPSIPVDILHGMITYTTRLNEEVMVKRAFAREGAPWEFNLRDVIRWASLLRASGPDSSHPIRYLHTLFLQRFRTSDDRRLAKNLFQSIFSNRDDLPHNPTTEPILSPGYLQVGYAVYTREGCSLVRRTGRILQTQLHTLETMTVCINSSWLTILSGPRRSGKTSLVRLMAHLTGHTLQEISINAATDATDILGSFEEVDLKSRVAQLLGKASILLARMIASMKGSRLPNAQQFVALAKSLQMSWSEDARLGIMEKASSLLNDLEDLRMPNPAKQTLTSVLNELLEVSQRAGRFEWIDGPLVRALREGLWICLDGANLCNPSVLDRLNSLCEADGMLILNERGAVNGQVETIRPHTNFRLFMCVDSYFGELSRAMRNRGVEVALLPAHHAEDKKRLLDHMRLPSGYAASTTDFYVLPLHYELVRRGLTIVEQPAAVTGLWPSDMLLDEDTLSSSIVAISETLSLCTQLSPAGFRAVMYFTAQSVSPQNIGSLVRFLRSTATVQPQRDSISTLLRELSRSRILDIVKRCRLDASQAQSYPLELLLAQPMDLKMNTSILGPLSSQNDKMASILLMLRLFVTLSIFNDPACNPYPMANAADRPGSSVQERTLHASMSVVRALIDAAHNLYAFIDVTVNTAKADLAAMLHLLNCAGYLKKVVSDSTLDYSAMHVVSQLLHESLREPRQHLSEVLVSVQALSDMVALKSGLGMSEIWKALSAPNVSDADMTKLLQLDNAAVALPRDMQDTRPRILQLMAMSTLPMSYSQQDDLDTLINKLQTQIPSHMEAEKGLQRRHLDPSSLITELGFLASLYGYLSDPSETFIRTAQEVLKLACQDPSSSLLRLVPYQHAIWSAEAGRPMLPLIADMHRQWLESIWDVKEQAGLEGPSLLLVPVELLNTIAHCDHDVQTLLLLDTYEVTLGRHIRSLLAQSIPTADRLTQLTIVLSQCILMVSSSFRHAFEPAEYTALVSLPNHTAFVPGSNQWPELLTHLERANHAAFGAAVKRHLRPYICRIDSESKDMRCVIGEGWIAFARLLLELFVPDSPIDPAALQKCYQDFGNEERAVLTFQISMHEDLEMRTSGDRSNGTISYLEKMLAEGDAKLPKYDTPAPTRSRNDIARLHTYWSEVQQFLNQVLSPHKLEAYISIAISGDPGALAREHVIQNSIFAFSQRLNTVYKDFEDINMPIQLALSSMRLGLRLVTDSGKLEALTSPDAKVPLARGLLASPSVRSAELIRIQTSPSEASEFSSSLLMTKLSGIVFQVMLGSDLRDYMHEVDQVYERALGLWLVDLSRAEESEREAQSLYRRKIEEDFKEDETEEEFLSMFPEFEDVLDDHIPSQAKISPQRPLLIGASSILQLFEMHQELFLDGNGSQRITSSVRFVEQRRYTVKALIGSHISMWPEALDRESLAFQTRLLHDRLTGLRTSARARSYDFYLDENISEARKAISLLDSLVQRLDSLIAQWPDQMVLQHLKTRCEMIMSFGLRSSVAKILSALEHLLLSSEDWEMYANRDNSLKVHQQALIGLIVEWRRLELSAWQGLLDTQATIFAKGASEWWFRLYDATIRGVLNISPADREEGEIQQAVSAFLEDLVPLLDDFLSQGPMGQFQTRIGLVQSMEVYADKLAAYRNEDSSSPLRRVHRVLRTTRCYYTQFSPRVSSTLAEQRKGLEKDIRGFIKLASWKDVNVHALKQSAQKTHRQLYKIIRKFRQILRQPVSNLLQPVVTENEGRGSPQEIKSGIRTSASTVDELSFPDTPSPSTYPRHLSNLPLTYRNFASLIEQRLRLFIESHSSHNVESLAGDIISTSKALAASVIPANLDATRRMKLQKNILTRKRKAWSDLLKELKRAGLSGHVKPEILAQHNSRRWVREQPMLSSDLYASSAILKAEEYFYVLLGLLPDLRASLSDHHPDISTRELQRAVMHIESGFSLALQCRSRLANVTSLTQEAQQMRNRLFAVSKCPRITGAGPGVPAYVSFARDVVNQLEDALQELSQQLQGLQDDQCLTSFPASILPDIGTLVVSLQAQTITLDRVWQDVNSTKYPILLSDEEDNIRVSLSRCTEAAECLRRWADSFSCLEAFIRPVQVWLESKRPPLCDAPRHATWTDPENRVIDTLLLSVQSTLGISAAADAEFDRESTNNYIREDCNLLSHMSNKLNLPKVIDDLHTLLSGLAASECEVVQRCSGRLLPFLDRYLSLVEEHIVNQSIWTKSLFRLNFVLCSIVRSVAKDGFCQPKDTEEGDSVGEGQEMGEGAGMGEGSGNENVSKEIQDESQVEGLQGEDEGENDDVERAEEGNAIEMSEDFGGALQDVPQEEEEEDGETQSDDESQGDPEEQLGDLDAGDEDVIDEKLWGDEQGPQDKDDGGKTDQDHSKQETSDSDMVAKEEERSASKENPKSDSAQPTEDETEPPVTEEQSAEGETEPPVTEEQPAEDEDTTMPDGRPLDDHIENNDTLDIPDDLNLDMGENQDVSAEVEDDPMNDQSEGEDAEGDGAQPDEAMDEMDIEDEGGLAQAMQEDAQEGSHEDVVDDAVAQPDTHAGDGIGTEAEASAVSAGTEQSVEPDKESQSKEYGGETGGTPDEMKVQDPSKPSGNDSAKEMPTQQSETEQSNEQTPSAADVGGTQRGQSTSTARQAQPLSTNPLRSLGDALQEIIQRFDEILESDGNPETDMPSQTAQGVSQVEYMQQESADDMQALGPAGQEDVAKLQDLKLVDDDQPREDQVALGEQRGPEPEQSMPPHPAALRAEPTSEGLREGVDSALTPADVRSRLPGSTPDAHSLSIPATELPLPEEHDAEEKDLEMELREWQSRGQPSIGAEEMWRRYESLTQDLSYALSEQLRLILEPTMATRLKGDYRTGKRLNMKKIIPYIASEYTKDKIWLRRTRPSQREYQVLIALDDSRSMAESHSVHLAYQTLALVSKALSRLEVGDVAIAKFGQTVDVLHGFDGGPFTNQSGTKVMDAFHFDQKATQVLSLLETSLNILEQARERRAMTSATAADLWQMEIIISDGICQDHERLRTILRKAEEQRVMVVFIILDSLHTGSMAPPPGQPATSNSILSMNQVAYTDVNGKMDLTVRRYLDTFPFEYYVIVRDVEALPDVLSGTLKQFFERISEE